MSRSKNNSKNTGKNAVRPYTVMCTDMYLLWILVVFPLYYADGYFHLPEKKAMFWTVSTLVYVIVCMFGAVITAFSMRENWSMENFKKNITMTDVFMFGFLISNLIALAISDDPMSSWVGQNARYYGARVLILVCVAYFLVSRYAWINQVFIWAFLIGGNGVCLLATFDYFGMDVLGINKQMQHGDWLMFISTMGNANTCASYVTMAVAGAICYFCVAKGIKEKVFAGISVVNCSMALITARSDSAFVGLAIVFLMLGIMAVVRKIEWKNYILALILVDMGLLILFLLRKKFVDYLIWEAADIGFLRTLNQPELLAILLVVLVAIYVLVFAIDKKNIKVKKNVAYFIWGILGVAIIIFGVALMNKFKLLQMFKEAMGIGENLVVGARGYIYSRAINAYGQLPLINKIFGCGQATISHILNQYFGDELSTAGININSAHNNILDYLIITGFFGIVCYLGILLNAIKQGFTAFKENKYAIVFVGVVIAYFAQGLFNIDQTNTTTIYWLMIACCEAVYRNSVIKKEDY